MTDLNMKTALDRRTLLKTAATVVGGTALCGVLPDVSVARPAPSDASGADNSRDV